MSYNPVIIPSNNGETLDNIHNRTAYALARIIAEIDKEWAEEGTGPRAILICTHAATNIAAGRALTGIFPLLSFSFLFPAQLTSLTMYFRRSNS